MTLTSPNATYDSLFLSNYATINIRDELSRLSGVGNVTGVRRGQYSMRVWLDPNKLQVRKLMPQDVIMRSSSRASRSPRARSARRRRRPGRRSSTR